VTDQFTRQFIDVDTFEVIDPLAPKVENGRAQHPADAVASAVEYVSVHGERSVIGPALSIKKLRQPIEKSYGIRAAPKRSGGELLHSQMCKTDSRRSAP
jgi:hypothetical protein